MTGSWTDYRWRHLCKGTWQAVIFYISNAVLGLASSPSLGGPSPQTANGLGLSSGQVQTAKSQSARPHPSPSIRAPCPGPYLPFPQAPYPHQMQASGSHPPLGSPTTWSALVDACMAPSTEFPPLPLPPSLPPSLQPLSRWKRWELGQDSKIHPPSYTA